MLNINILEILIDLLPLYSEWCLQEYANVLAKKIYLNFLKLDLRGATHPHL